MVFVNEVRPMSSASLTADQLQFLCIICESLIRVYIILVFKYYDPDSRLPTLPLNPTGATTVPTTNLRTKLNERKDLARSARSALTTC